MIALESDLHSAISAWIGDAVTGPWEDFAGLLTLVIDSGELTLHDAAKLAALLDQTRR